MSSLVSSAPRQALNARQAETVERLLAAGAEELRAVGVDGLTIRTVAHRAGVSPATAYTYFSSKTHLFAELFWRALVSDTDAEPRGDDPVARVRSVTRHMAEMLGAAPELAAGATLALLGTDPEVERLRLLTGRELVARFRAALDAHGGGVGDVLVDTLVLAFTGAMLQAGMGLTTYAEMGDRLDAVVETILRGHR